MVNPDHLIGCGCKECWRPEDETKRLETRVHREPGRAVTPFWSSTAAGDHLAAIQRHGEVGGTALRHAALTEAARLAMCSKSAAADLTPKQRTIALLLLIDSALAGDEFETTGSSTAWGAKICVDRETVSEAIWRFRTLGLLDVLADGKRHVPWHLRWLFLAEEWQAIQDDAAAIVRKMLADATHESGAKPNYLIKSAV